MFRGVKPSELSAKNFGAGSTISAGPQDKWLVVAEFGRFIRLVDLKTFETIDGSVEVDDPNFITEEEARQAVRLINNNYTFSDYELSPKGQKTLS